MNRIVVHLAAIPAPELQPEGVTVEVDTLSSYDLFHAPTLVGIDEAGKELGFGPEYSWRDRLSD